MTKIPSKFATIELAYGSGGKHLYSVSDQEIAYFPDEATARADIKERIVNGEKMVALMEIKGLFVRSTDYEEIKT